MAMKDKLSNKSIFDASSYQWVQIKQVAQIISGFTGAKITYGTKDGRNHKAYNVGRVPEWLPQIELADGIKKMIDIAKNNAK